MLSLHEAHAALYILKFLLGVREQCRHAGAGGWGDGCWGWGMGAGGVGGWVLGGGGWVLGVGDGCWGVGGWVIGLKQTSENENHV